MKKSIYRVIITVATSITLVIGCKIDTPTDTQPNTKNETSNEVMRTLFSFQTQNPWIIPLPESSNTNPILVPLTELKQTEQQYLAIGHYAVKDGEQHAVESGSLALDYSKITPLPLGSQDQEMVFVAPFAVSNQGTGLFWYLGLFRLNQQTAHISHIDSLFLDDRIKLQTITPIEPFDVTQQLQVSYLKHSAQQAMAESPKQVVERTIDVSLMGFKL